MTYYDRILATNLSECADRNLKLWPEHQEIMMIIKWQCNSESDLSQPEGAHEECKAAGVSYLVLLCTFFFSLYSSLPWQLSVQDCCFSKNVPLLCTADVQATIPGVTSGWGNSNKAVSDATRAETLQCCDYYFSLWPNYFTYYWN